MSHPVTHPITGQGGLFGAVAGLHHREPPFHFARVREWHLNTSRLRQGFPRHVSRFQLRTKPAESSADLFGDRSMRMLVRQGRAEPESGGREEPGGSDRPSGGGRRPSGIASCSPLSYGGASKELARMSIERTAAGLQMVIPGCEQRSLPKSTTRSDDHGQGLLNFYRSPTLREKLAGRVCAPLRPRRGQQPPPRDGLFV